MTLTARLFMLLVRQVGRRGVFLLFIAVLALGLAFGLFAAPTTQQSIAIGRLIPLWVWGSLWAAVGVACLVQAFMLRDWVAYMAAVFLLIVWAGLYFVAWATSIVERGWLAGVIYMAFAGLTAVVGTWPEDPLGVRRP